PAESHSRIFFHIAEARTDDVDWIANISPGQRIDSRLGESIREIVLIGKLIADFQVYLCITSLGLCRNDHLNPVCGILHNLCGLVIKHDLDCRAVITKVYAGDDHMITRECRSRNHPSYSRFMAVNNVYTIYLFVRTA